MSSSDAAAAIMASLTPPPKQYPSEYPGEVVSIDDALLRVKVRAAGLFDGVPESDLPWAIVKLPLGSRPGEGIHMPCRVGDWVWVDFPFRGDSRYPRVTGSLHYCPDSAPNYPHEVWGGPAPVEHKRTGAQPAPDPVSGPEDFAAKINGVSLEITRDGSLRATNLSTGTGIEITREGKLTFHGESDGFLSTVGDWLEEITGKSDEKVGGKKTIDAAGIDLIGGGTPKGVVQGDCVCAFTGGPHPHVSATVKATP